MSDIYTCHCLSCQNTRDRKAKANRKLWSCSSCGAPLTRPARINGRERVGCQKCDWSETYTDAPRKMEWGDIVPIDVLDAWETAKWEAWADRVWFDMMTSGQGWGKILYGPGTDGVTLTNVAHPLAIEPLPFKSPDRALLELLALAERAREKVYGVSGGETTILGLGERDEHKLNEIYRSWVDAAAEYTITDDLPDDCLEEIEIDLPWPEMRGAAWQRALLRAKLAGWNRDDTLWYIDLVLNGD